MIWSTSRMNCSGSAELWNWVDWSPPTILPGISCCIKSQWILTIIHLLSGLSRNQFLRLRLGKWEDSQKTKSNYHSMQFFFLFIGREPTMWPANNCLQTIVCSGAMSSNCVWLQIIFCSCSVSDRSCVKMADRFASGRYSLQNKLGDRMMRQLLNSVIAEYRDLSVASRSTIQGHPCQRQFSANYLFGRRFEV